jgi:hypothetical protein
VCVDAGKPGADEVATEEVADEVPSDAAAKKEDEDAGEETTKAAKHPPDDVAKPAQAGADARVEHLEEDELSLGDSDDEEGLEATAAADPDSRENQPEDRKEDLPHTAAPVRSFQPRCMFQSSVLQHATR